MSEFPLLFTVSSYNPDDRFDVSALCRLEAVGIEVVTSLSLAILSAYNTVGLTLEWDGVYNSDPKTQCWWRVEGQVDCFIRKWAESARTLDSPSLTWRSLVRVLKTLELKELSQQMEEYLTAYSKANISKLVVSQALPRLQKVPRLQKFPCAQKIFFLSILIWQK